MTSPTWPPRPAHARGPIGRPRCTGAAGGSTWRPRTRWWHWLQGRLEDVDEIEAFVSGRAKEVRSVEQKLRTRDRLQPGRDKCLHGPPRPDRRPGRRAPRERDRDRGPGAAPAAARRQGRRRPRRAEPRGDPGLPRPALRRARPARQRAPRAAHRPARGDPGQDPRRGPVGLAGARAAVQGRRRAAPGAQPAVRPGRQPPGARRARARGPARLAGGHPAAHSGAAAAPSREAAAPWDEAALAGVPGHSLHRRRTEHAPTPGLDARAAA